jgi:imidazolonepropionase-like amidohydrolase
MGRIHFTNARLVDGDGSTRTGVSVVVEGERIARVVEGGGVEQPESGDEVYDLGGRTIMPGMVIGHYHATYTNIGPGSPPVGMEAPPAMQTLRAVKHLGLALRSGFTGVVSAGAPYAIDASCKAAIAEGLIEGPRIVPGSRDVSTTGHLQDLFYQWHWGPGMGPQTNVVDGVDGFRRAVREEAKRGAEIIKIFASTGHGLPAARYSMEMTEEELGTAIETAHQRGIRARAHLARKDAIMAAVRLGIDVVDHGDGLDRECIDLMVEKGTFLVPSLYFPYRVTEIAPDAFEGEMKSDLAKMLAILPEANARGVKIVLGDDYGAMPLDHGQYGGELEFYVKVAGFPAPDVIRWATRHGAELMGMGDELGLIREGYLADLLIVDGDPIADISVLKTPASLLAVMKGGVFASHALGPFLASVATPGNSAHAAARAMAD